MTERLHYTIFTIFFTMLFSTAQQHESAMRTQVSPHFCVSLPPPSPSFSFLNFWMQAYIVIQTHQTVDLKWVCFVICKLHVHKTGLGLPWWLSGKESTCQCRRCRFSPWSRKIPCRREWQPTLVFLPGKSHGQRSLVGYSPWGCRDGHDLATEQKQQQKDLKK